MSESNPRTYILITAHKRRLIVSASMGKVDMDFPDLEQFEVVELSAVKELLDALKLALSFCPNGPVPSDLAPMFYHTLSYEEEVKLQERIDNAREALKKWEGVE